MTQEEVVKILTDYNDWRRGNTNELNHSPTTIGEALEKAIELLQKQKEPDLIEKLLNPHLYVITMDELTVEGNLDLKGTSIQSLPNGLHVRGNLILYNTLIQSLPIDLRVDGDLDLHNTPIKSLPIDLRVDGDLDLRNTPFKSLPYGLVVHGDLDLRNTPIKSLPNYLMVDLNLYLSNTPLSKMYTKDEIRDMVESNGGYVQGYIYV